MEKGYGDMEFALDFDTIRVLKHLPKTAIIQCDLTWLDESPVIQSPRTILKAQVEKATQAGYVAKAGTELEFIVFDTTYEEAWSSNYRDLTPSNQYNVDYSILGTSRVEPLLRDIRNTMYAAGMDVECAKGECNFGQHEIGFLYDDVVATADNHSVYKTAAKEIAAQHGQALTFMAKYNEREGNSCHIHLSLRGLEDEIVFWRDGARTPLYDQFIAGGPNDDARLYVAVRAERQFIQTFRRRFFRPDHRCVGTRQPLLRDPVGGEGSGGADGEPRAWR